MDLPDPPERLHHHAGIAGYRRQRHATFIGAFVKFQVVRIHEGAALAHRLPCGQFARVGPALLGRPQIGAADLVAGGITREGSARPALNSKERTRRFFMIRKTTCPGRNQGKCRGVGWLKPVQTQPVGFGVPA
jgi:hypothetical protein